MRMLIMPLALVALVAPAAAQTQPGDVVNALQSSLAENRAVSTYRGNDRLENWVATTPSYLPRGRDERRKARRTRAPAASLDRTDPIR